MIFVSLHPQTVSSLWTAFVFCSPLCLWILVFTLIHRTKKETLVRWLNSYVYHYLIWLLFVLFCTVLYTGPVKMITKMPHFSWFLVIYFKYVFLFNSYYVETRVVLASWLMFSIFLVRKDFLHLFLEKMVSRAWRLWKNLHQGLWQLSQFEGLCILLVSSLVPT